MIQTRSYLAVALAAGAVFALGHGRAPVAGPVHRADQFVHRHRLRGDQLRASRSGQMMWARCQPVAGAIADRWGPRPVMLGGAVLVAAATARHAVRDLDHRSW